MVGQFVDFNRYVDFDDDDEVDLLHEATEIIVIRESELNRCGCPIRLFASPMTPSMSSGGPSSPSTSWRSDTPSLSISRRCLSLTTPADFKSGNGEKASSVN